MTLRLRLVAVFAYVLVLVLLALEIPLALSIADRIRTEVNSEAAAQARVVAAAAASARDDPEALQRVAERASDDLGGRVVIVDERGRLVADTAGGGLLGTSYRSRPEIADALAGRLAQGTRASETLGEDLLYTAVPVLDEGRTVGAVRVTQSDAAVAERVRRSVLGLAAVGLIALVLGLAVAWVVAGSVVRPLHRLAETARRVAGGDLDARAPAEGSREQQEVAAAFNDMTDRLGRSLAAQRDFVGNAAHQLRTPLTGLLLRLEAAADKSGDAELARELRAAQDEARRLARLLGALLVLAREGDRPPLRQSTSLADAASRAAERWGERAVRAGVRLDRVGQPDVLAAVAPEDLDAMLDNLIENALLYGHGGETLTLEWGVRDQSAWIAVCDEGAGIAADEAERVFERFARGSAGRTSPGTGLGLAVVRALAERWGGVASIANRDGGGARAEVRFPLGHGAAARRASAEAVA